MSMFAPPTVPSTEPPHKAKKWPIVVGALILAGVASNALAKKDTTSPDTPAKSGDVCFWLRDGSAGNLTPGEWQDLGGFSSHGLMVQYVTANCPEQLARVDG